ncbi:MAG: nicotinate (nicotinamide) nucleotide adenylyltransferase [Rikenellaceae bacterium]
MKKRVMLYFGSFNPVHRGHIALCEYVIEQGLCDEVALVVSPHNPLKEATGLAPEFERFTMTELATKESKYPDRIKASIIEFLLEKPSYTLNTLDYLTANHGELMEFSILMGEDNLAIIDKWRDYQTILTDFKVYVYPREGVDATRFIDCVTVLHDAPLHNFSSTSVREALVKGVSVKEMIHPSVEKHIKDSGLWKQAIK